MSQLEDKFKALFRKLFPQGKAWQFEADSALSNLSDGMAIEPSRLDGRVSDFLIELNPATTTQLIDAWEADVGIPNECEPVATTLEQRRIAVIRKLKLQGRGGASRAFFEFLASEFGYTATVNDCFPARAGRLRAGDRLFGMLWLHWFQVQSENYVVTDFRAGANRSGERLREFYNSELECVIERSKPAHTRVQFLYGS